MAMEMRSGYRAEIDGLRAVSVLGVLLFHAGLGLPGGYVGVDVFFVISGFLISGIILRDLDAGSFTLRRFWARRIRRIVPAVSVVTCLSLVAGYWLLDPSALEDLSESAIAQALLYANIFFLRDSGYFSEAADLKPLLHTWTLAVEEQFYLLFPLALALIHKLGKRRIFLVLAVAAALSLVVGIDRIETSPSECFYLLPMRAWELLAGALLAVAQHRIHLTRRRAEWLGWAGLGMILVAMFSFSAETPFPGSAALLPVAGAAAFIASSCNRTPMAARLLSTRPAVFLGLISYSLYLWHWPLFSLSKHVFIDVTIGIRLSLVALSVILAYLSWRLIENPFRHSRLLGGERRTFAFGAATVLVILGSSHWIRAADGIPRRLSEHELTLVEDITWRGRDFFVRRGLPRAIGAHPAKGIIAEARQDGDGLELNQTQQAEIVRRTVPDFVYWGDSHGMMLGDLVDRSASEYGLAGEAYLTAARPPVPGLWRPSWSEDEIEECLTQNRRIKESILQRGVANVVLVGRWSVYASGRTPLEAGDPSHLLDSLATDEAGMSARENTPKSAIAAIRRQLDAMVQELSDAGVRVWILKQVPETDDLKSARHFYQAQRFPFVDLPDLYSVSLEVHRLRQRHAEMIFAGLSAPGLTVIDPSPAFFANEAKRLHVYSERSHYRDDDHLTRYGADRFLGETFDGIFAVMVESKR
jgi:peptidoglycan/LPS O-acetylase OafA/YrhL